MDASILNAETEAVIGCAFEVLKEIGPGLPEIPYQNALIIEFDLRAIPFEQQRRHDILYKTVKIGEYVPEVTAFGEVLVDVKEIARITDHEVGQMLNYLQITGHPVGVILNFRHTRLEWKRVVNAALVKREPPTDTDGHSAPESQPKRISTRISMFLTGHRET